MKVIKDYMLEDPERMTQIIFFLITFFIFLFCLIHAFKMKKNKMDEIAQIVLKDDSE